MLHDFQIVLNPSYDTLKKNLLLFEKTQDSRNFAVKKIFKILITVICHAHNILSIFPQNYFFSGVHETLKRQKKSTSV